jgi:hypothetical protein
MDKLNFDFIYDETNMGYKITKYNGKHKALIIPNTIMNKPVVSIDADVLSHTENTNVIVLGKNVIDISKDAFRGVKSLVIYAYKNFNFNNNFDTNITIRYGLDEILEINDVYFGLFDNHTAIAFDHDFLDARINNYGKYGRLIVLEEVVREGYELVGIENGCFKHAFNLKSLLISDSLRWIGNEAFKGCEILDKIEFFGVIEKIGDEAFSDCQALKTVIFNDTVNHIGSNILMNSSKSMIFFSQKYDEIIFHKDWNDNRPVLFNFFDLVTKENLTYALSNDLKAVVVNHDIEDFTDLIIPSVIAHGLNDYRVTEISPHCFRDSKYLLSVDLPYSIKRIHDYAFVNTAIRTITFPNDIELLGEGVVAQCIYLKEIIYPRNLFYVSNNVAYGCKSLEHVALYEGIEKIGESSFQDCSRLANIKFPKSLVSIGPMSFYGTILSSVIFGDKLEFIGELAFEGNQQLSTIVFSNSNTILDEHAMPHKNRIKVFIIDPKDDKTSQDIRKNYNNIKVYNDVKEIVYNKGIYYLISEDNTAIVFSHDANDLPTHVYIDSYINGSKVIGIEEKAFYSNSKMESLYVPDSITYFKSHFISKCMSLTKVSIPKQFNRIYLSWFEDSINAEFEVRD